MLYYVVMMLLLSGHHDVYAAVERPLRLVQTAAVLEVPITSNPPNLASCSLPTCSKLYALLLSNPPLARRNGALSGAVHATADPVQVLRHLGHPLKFL